MGSSTSRPSYTATDIIPSPLCVPNPHYPAIPSIPLDLEPPPSKPSLNYPRALTPQEKAARTRKQAGLFFGGLTFVLFSGFVTRRSLVKRQKAIVSPILNAVGKPGAPGAKGALKTADGAAAEIDPAAELNNSGPILAIEALTVATLNVISWGIMATGGALWYFDIASIDDMRRKIRGGLGVDGSGRTEEEAEEEVEEWLATVLSRKDNKSQRRREEETWRQKRQNDLTEREEFEEFQKFKNERGRSR
jgi:hypothetical protein